MTGRVDRLLQPVVKTPRDIALGQGKERGKHRYDPALELAVAAVETVNLERLGVLPEQGRVSSFAAGLRAVAPLFGGAAGEP